MLILQYTWDTVLPWPTAYESLNTPKEQSFPQHRIKFPPSLIVLALL